MCQLEVVIYIENWSILVLSLLGTALDNRVSQKLLGNPDYCSGATDPSFIDNCAKPINVLSQGASFDPQPEFYQQKRETMIFHNYFQQPIFLTNCINFSYYHIKFMYITTVAKKPDLTLCESWFFDFMQNFNIFIPGIQLGIYSTQITHSLI